MNAHYVSGCKISTSGTNLHTKLILLSKWKTSRRGRLLFQVILVTLLLFNEGESSQTHTHLIPGSLPSAAEAVRMFIHQIANISASIFLDRLLLSHCLENISLTSLILIVPQKANAFKSPDLEEKSLKTSRCFESGSHCRRLQAIVSFQLWTQLPSELEPAVDLKQPGNRRSEFSPDPISAFNDQGFKLPEDRTASSRENAKKKDVPSQRCNCGVTPFRFCTTIYTFLPQSGEQSAGILFPLLLSCGSLGASVIQRLRRPRKERPVVGQVLEGN